MHCWDTLQLQRVLVLLGLHWGVRLLGSIKRLWLHLAAAADWSAMHQLQVNLHRKNLDNISLYRGVKLVSRKMVGLDDLPITSSESEFTASSGGEDVYELYEWFSRMGVDHLKSSSRKLLCHHCKYKHSVILMCSNFLMSIKTERELVFCYCKGTRRHINRMNTICTLFILKQTKLQQN